jgi:hypothetical protein
LQRISSPHGRESSSVFSRRDFRQHDFGMPRRHAPEPSSFLRICVHLRPFAVKVFAPAFELQINDLGSLAKPQQFCFCLGRSSCLFFGQAGEMAEWLKATVC